MMICNTTEKKFIFCIFPLMAVGIIIGFFGLTTIIEVLYQKKIEHISNQTIFNDTESSF